MSAERVFEDAAAFVDPTSYVALVNFRRRGPANWIGSPAFATTESFIGQRIVRAHDRAPKVASQIHLGFEFAWRGEVTAGNIQIEKAIVV